MDGLAVDLRILLASYSFDPSLIPRSMPPSSSSYHVT